jgi:hypothetical protein
MTTHELESTEHLVALVKTALDNFEQTTLDGSARCALRVARLRGDVDTGFRGFRLRSLNITLGLMPPVAVLNRLLESVGHHGREILWPQPESGRRTLVDPRGMRTQLGVGP